MNQEKFKVNGCDRLQAFIVLFFFLVIFGFFYYVFWAVTGPDTQGMPQGMLDLISLFRKILAPLFALAMFVVCLWCLAPLRTYYTLDPEGIGLHEYTDWGLKAPLAHEIKPWSDIARVGITERGKIRVAFHSRDSIESRWPVAKPGTFESRSRYWHLQQTGRGAHAGPSIQLNNSNVGVFNTGAILNEGSISPIISSVAFQGHTEVANAFKALTEAIAQSNELKETQRTELLDTIKELARQASLPIENRSKPAVIKSLYQYLATTLGALGGLAEVWSMWGKSIKEFFGL